jgi:arylsulfatase A-like enzyme
VRPGQYAGRLGPRYEAWHVDIAAPCALGNGACPHCFRFDGTPFRHEAPSIFDTPMLSLPEGGQLRLNGRMGLLDNIENQQRALERVAETARLDRHRRQALSVLADPKVRSAFDVEHADPQTLERYGKNKFGLSTLMAYRLAAAGVNLVQVNLGKNSSWDTHRRNFPNLRDNLLPYLDRCVSALLDDLAGSGLLESTLVVVTGEFGRTPRINNDGGRDHWAPTMTVLLAGAGVRGGNVIGATDAIAAYPVADRQTPENLAATIYETLGIPRMAEWTDFDGRPHELYRGEPIGGLM